MRASLAARAAAASGAIVFWLAKEKEGLHNCSRAYAQTSRFELGMFLHASPIVGIEPGFSGEEYLTYTLKKFGVLVSSSLAETIDRVFSEFFIF